MDTTDTSTHTHTHIHTHTHTHTEPYTPSQTQSQTDTHLLRQYKKTTSSLNEKNNDEATKLEKGKGKVSHEICHITFSL